MTTKNAEKSQKILETLKANIESFKALFKKENEESIKQNILRSIILFSCAGIDAIVKQLILESLEWVIERDEGAQHQFRQYVNRKLKKDIGEKLSLLTDIVTAKDSRRLLINLLRQDLSFDSLQNTEQLFRVAEHFNIRTNELVDKEDEQILKKAFAARNIIVHQMDVKFDKTPIEYYNHTIDEANQFYETIIIVAQKFIDEGNHILEKEITKDYLPPFTYYDGTFEINI